MLTDKDKLEALKYATRGVESGHGRNIVNPESTATGEYQILQPTMAWVRKQMGQPEASYEDVANWLSNYVYNRAGGDPLKYRYMWHYGTSNAPTEDNPKWQAFKESKLGGSEAEKALFLKEYNQALGANTSKLAGNKFPNISKQLTPQSEIAAPKITTGETEDTSDEYAYQPTATVDKLQSVLGFLKNNSEGELDEADDPDYQRVREILSRYKGMPS